MLILMHDDGGKICRIRNNHKWIKFLSHNTYGPTDFHITHGKINRSYNIYNVHHNLYGPSYIIEGYPPEKNSYHIDGQRFTYSEWLIEREKYLSGEKKIEEKWNPNDSGLREKHEPIMIDQDGNIYK